MENTASIIGCDSIKDEIIIPYSISIKEKEFTSISEKAFKFSQAKSIIIPNYSEIHVISKKAFFKSSIETFAVTQHLTHIEESAFAHCLQLRTVNIPNNSELQMIGKYAFSHSSIESFTVPTHLTYINEGIFEHCSQLRTINISLNSKLQTIDKYAFSYSSIESFTIPSGLIDLKEGWCHETEKLINIKVSSQNQRYIGWPLSNRNFYEY